MLRNIFACIGHVIILTISGATGSSEALVDRALIEAERAKETNLYSNIRAGHTAEHVTAVGDADGHYGRSSGERILEQGGRGVGDVSNGSRRRGGTGTGGGRHSYDHGNGTGTGTGPGEEHASVGGGASRDAAGSEMVTIQL